MDIKIKPVKIAASSLSFLTPCDACQFRQYYSVRQPRGPFPSVFTVIDGVNRDFYNGCSLKALSPDLPEGTLDCSERFVQSRIFHVKGRHTPFYITGRLDGLGSRSDGLGDVLVDFKTVDTKTQHVGHYTLQLGAYAVAMENPAPGKPQLGPITHMGLQCLMPRSMCASPTGANYLVEPTWIPLIRDDAALFEFISTRILRVLELPEEPDPLPGCEWCEFVEAVTKEI